MELTKKKVAKSFNKESIKSNSKLGDFISKVFFLWVIPLFRKLNSKNLKVEDLDKVTSDNKSENLTETLEREWESECNKSAQEKSKPKLVRALLQAFGSHYALYVAIFMFDGWVIRIAQPIFLRLFIRTFSDTTTSTLFQCLYAAGVCFTTLIHILLNHPTAFQMCISGMKCRVAVSSLIYKKALRLSKAAQNKSSTGQIVNLLSNDVSRFDYNLHFIAFFFVGPVQLVIFFCILYSELGPASIAGVGYIALLSPSQYLIGKFSAKFRVEIGNRTDERSRIMSEIITAMRLIKMYAWEKPFSTVVNRIRSLEVSALKKRSFLRAAFMGVFTSNFTFVPFLAILAYALSGHQVTADKAFFAVAIFNVMTEIMMYYVPNAAATMGELLASLTRIEEFLQLEEQAQQSKLVVKDTIAAKPFIRLNQVHASWTEDKPTLKNITMDVSGNQLVMIVGPVGSGKSSFLQVLLSELPISRGKCSIEGKISYCSQDPWIFPGTIRENILLGREFSLELYNDVLNVCALEDDLTEFPYADMTMVGERGLTLSGGQKARVNLARALYQQSDIYILDSPMSAVDATTCQHIFDNCLQKHLKNTLKIVVTHQLQNISQADHIVVLADGRIVAQGKYEELIDEGIDFVGLLGHKSRDLEEDEVNACEKTATTYEEIPLSQKKSSLHKEAEDEEESKVEDEKMEAGSVSASTYWKYFQAGDSVCGISFLISGFITTQFLISTTDYWLSFWTNLEEKNRLQNQLHEATTLNPTFDSFYSDNDISTDTAYKIQTDYFRRNVYIIVYAGLAFTVFIVDTIRTLYLFAYCMRISNNIHNKMFASLIRAPMKFFALNSSGRVMNRFTKDIGALDEYLPISLFDTFDIFCRAIGVFTIVIITNYILVVPVLFLLVAYGYLRFFFVRTARNIKRLESIARSPMYTHLASTIQGLTTIRSSKSQKILTSQFNNLQDVHSTAWYHFMAGNNWFSVWLELTSTLFIIIVTYSFIIMSASTTSGNVGLAIASLLQLMNTFQFGMRQSAEAENLMTSVERALEYVKIEPEAPLRSAKGSPPKDWPQAGAIRFEEVDLSYDGKKDVLHDLSFDILPKEKIGIVGRTGAGKSSILNALLRMTEPRGEILIDNIVTCNLGLHDVRKNISIIPQESVLFSGTIRYNLDPFSCYTDDQLWSVLREVELKDAIPALDFEVLEGGCNFSVGQKQLICLARALLKNNKIIVLDEATANIDRKTDYLIQHTLRTILSDCTILTIAHRLDTIMDSDRVIVMENGTMKEFDHPHILLKNPNGIFTSLVSQTGKSAQTLRQLAAENYQRVVNRNLNHY